MPKVRCLCVCGLPRAHAEHEEEEHYGEEYPLEEHLGARLRLLWLLKRVIHGLLVETLAVTKLSLRGRWAAL